MVWSCFGFLDQCHIGNAYFRSETDGLCLNDADQERYDGVAPFKIVFCIINTRSLAHPHRHVTGWRDGIFMWTIDMPDTWDHMELTYDLPTDGIWEFKLQDTDTSEVLCSIMIGFNKDPIFEEEIPDEDVGEGVIDYDRIKGDVIDVENDLMGKINYVDYVNDIDRTNNKNDIVTDVRNQHDITNTYLGNTANMVIGLSNKVTHENQSILTSITGLGSSITSKIDSLGLPTLNSIKETFISAASEIADKILERIWDEIERRYEK